MVKTKPKLEVLELGTAALDYLDNHWKASTPRLLFSGWMKECFTKMRDLGKGDWDTMFQLYNPEQISRKTEPEYALRFIFLVTPPVAAGMENTAFERLLREQSLSYQCLLMLDAEGRVYEFMRVNP